MKRLPSLHLAFEFVADFVKDRARRARSQDASRGASAVEWVVISAIVVIIVGAIGYTISQALDTKSQEVSNCIKNTTTSSKC